MVYFHDLPGIGSSYPYLFSSCSHLETNFLNKKFIGDLQRDLSFTFRSYLPATLANIPIFSPGFFGYIGFYNSYLVFLAWLSIVHFHFFHYYNLLTFLVEITPRWFPLHFCMTSNDENDKSFFKKILSLFNLSTEFKVWQMCNQEEHFT